jgi:hypothetical protein
VGMCSSHGIILFLFLFLFLWGESDRQGGGKRIGERRERIIDFEIMGVEG